jgi:epidermal growth factor receptor substrate 15
MSSSTLDNNFSRFDSMSSTAQDRSFARFDSMSSNAGFDHGHTYSFDDSDPFGSSGPFKVSSESQTGKNETDKWAF